eukprot:scaffold88603_cov92-Phaeocystis_antarctica.AAC.1
MATLPGAVSAVQPAELDFPRLSPRFSLPVETDAARSVDSTEPECTHVHVRGDARELEYPTKRPPRSSQAQRCLPGRSGSRLATASSQAQCHLAHLSRLCLSWAGPLHRPSPRPSPSPSPLSLVRSHARSRARAETEAEAAPEPVPKSTSCHPPPTSPAP